MCIYIVEIPHQLKPICWSVSSKEKFIELVDKATERTDGECWHNAGWKPEAIEFDEDGEAVEWSYPPKTFEQAVEVNGSDLQAQMVFMNYHEAKQALKKGFTGHACIGAEEVLRKELLLTKGANFS